MFASAGGHTSVMQYLMTRVAADSRALHQYDCVRSACQAGAIPSLLWLANAGAPVFDKLDDGVRPSRLVGRTPFVPSPHVVSAKDTAYVILGVVILCLTGVCVILVRL